MNSSEKVVIWIYQFLLRLKKILVLFEFGESINIEISVKSENKQNI